MAQGCMGVKPNVKQAPPSPARCMQHKIVFAQGVILLMSSVDFQDNQPIQMGGWQMLTLYT